jgi:hypothetical protein
MTEQKSKEEVPMKRTRRRRYPYTRPVRRYAYPNAAERSYFTEKLLNGITAVVSCMGIVTILFFLITM